MNLNVRTEFAKDTKTAKMFVSDGDVLGNLYIPNSMWTDMGQPFVIVVDVVDGDQYRMHKVTYRYIKFAKRMLAGEALRRTSLPYVLMLKTTWNWEGRDDPS